VTCQHNSLPERKNERAARPTGANAAGRATAQQGVCLACPRIEQLPAGMRREASLLLARLLADATTSGSARCSGRRAHPHRRAEAQCDGRAHRRGNLKLAAGSGLIDEPQDHDSHNDEQEALR
jgi:hypothetical protein